MSTAAQAAGWRDWCKKEWVAPLQKNSHGPPRSALHVLTSAPPIHRTHQRPWTSHTRPSSERNSRLLATDHIGEYRPPAGTRKTVIDRTKFDARSVTIGWAPNDANEVGTQRAIYDPVSHKTTQYTFKKAGVERVVGRGDKLLRENAQKQREREPWFGRRKGVVEFVDRTHFYAVNPNQAFLRTCAKDPRAYHSIKGELTHWMDNAFESKMKVPFYEKRPYEMNR